MWQMTLRVAGLKAERSVADTHLLPYKQAGQATTARVLYYIFFLSSV